ncbi:hypothetical protein ONO39_26455, partial [Salmonella enterica subsp. enterica serovar Anatum]|nr:hypothetical protein [Salmonella enterica subsp. enterica serovar Anatum]
NGDILVWNPVLEDAFELSSMGIRVDADTLMRQLALTGDEDRLFVARSGLREVFSAVALFLVFGFGLLLEEVGLSMAMGAFLAGV